MPNSIPKICGGSLEPVLDAISYILKEKVHLEVTTMIMENFHTPEMIGFLGKNLKELGVQVWHLSRFFPCYRFSFGKPTSEAYLLEMLGQARLSAIPYIYGGNSSREDATYCPSCDTCLMTSHSYDKKSIQAIENGCCVHCGSAIYGVFS
ncbi:hypothetical protein [uncultured Sphaerochaeta sp.]|uniref:hypothetical protein n=1 Tax=uncultured Sphaerochaeta sp. TaxID=886478 RepID=UPI002A0A1A59|nr:hypothetical protein [uncultured Sphaerochaeta sp.]